MNYKLNYACLKLGWPVILGHGVYVVSVYVAYEITFCSMYKNNYSNYSFATNSPATCNSLAAKLHLDMLLSTPTNIFTSFDVKINSMTHVYRDICYTG